METTTTTSAGTADVLTNFTIFGKQTPGLSESAEKAVERGVEYLNKNYPCWLYRLDLKSLNIASNKKCIVGQLTGDYCSADELQKGGIWLSRHGFRTRFGITYDYTDLTKAWKKKITTMKKEENRFVRSVKKMLSNKIYS